MTSFIPFVKGPGDAVLARELFADSPMSRILDCDLQKVSGGVKTPLWVDPGFDGFPPPAPKEGRRDPPWQTHMKAVLRSDYDKLCDESVLHNPRRTASKDAFGRAVPAALNACMKHDPTWLTVPQLAQTEGTDHNSANRLMAELAGKWRASSGFKGSFVVPIIFTHSKQTAIKQEWGNTIKTAKRCVDESEATHIWVVDTSIQDQTCMGTNREKFQKQIDFHNELREAFPKQKIITGPYWGLNVVIWARGLADYLAVSLGSSFRYYRPGGVVNRPVLRIAVPPLRRWVRTGPETKSWLQDALACTAKGEWAHDQLTDLIGRYDLITSSSDAAKHQIAQTYRKWLNSLSAKPEAGRALALYQDFSSAYVLGKNKELGDLPHERGRARHPYLPAQQFMTSCL